MEMAETLRAEYFSGIIAQNAHDPQVLFKTINTIIKPECTADPNPSENTCEIFLKFLYLIFFFLSTVDYIISI